MMVQPSPPTLAAFLAVVFIVGLGLVRIYSPGRWLRGLGVLALWMLVTALPTALGLLDPAAPLPAVPLFFLALLGAATALALWSRAAVALAPLGLLIGLQGFRLPLELVLHAWVAEGVVPAQMTWSGSNPDILTGVLCLALAPFAGRKRWVAWLANGLGIVLLLNVIRVVASSFPGPLQAFAEPVPLVFGVPTVWIGSVCVAGAWALHLSTSLRLLAPAEPESPVPPA